MNEKNLNLKVRYDSALDELFFSKKFIEAFLEKFKHVPSGLTLDTRFSEKTGELYFVLCCKKYGYDYSGERVVGDFVLNKYEGFTDEMLVFCVNYLSENNPELYNEIGNNKIFY